MLKKDQYDQFVWVGMITLSGAAAAPVHNIAIWWHPVARVGSFFLLKVKIPVRRWTVRSALVLSYCFTNSSSERMFSFLLGEHNEKLPMIDHLSTEISTEICWVDRWSKYHCRVARFVTVTMNTAWLLEECRFIFVSACAQALVKTGDINGGTMVEVCGFTASHLSHFHTARSGSKSCSRNSSWEWIRMMRRKTTRQKNKRKLKES